MRDAQMSVWGVLHRRGTGRRTWALQLDGLGIGPSATGSCEVSGSLLKPPGPQLPVSGRGKTFPHRAAVRTRVDALCEVPGRAVAY